MLDHLLWIANVFQAADGDVMGGLFGGIGGLLGLIIGVLAIVGMWKVFTKAGKPGWAAIIPFFNFYTLIKVAGRPGWWLILLFVPFLNIVILILVNMDVARAFGKGAFLWGFVLLTLLPFLGFILLGFGDAQYQKPANA